MKEEKKEVVLKDKDAGNRPKRNFIPIESNFVRFEEHGQSIEGEITSIEESESYGFGIYTIKDDDGTIRKFHGSKQLDDFLQHVVVGSYIRVTYVGDQNLPTGTLKQFNVEIAK